MIKTVSAYEARTKLGELMNLVYYQGIDIVVKRMGKPMVRIVRVDDLVEEEVDFKKSVLSLAGVWDNRDGDIIEKCAKKIRKTGRFISP